MAKGKIMSSCRRVLPTFNLKRNARTVMTTVGGKERIANNLIRLAPSDVGVVAIPCMGGMSFAVAIARRYASDRDVNIILSDIDKDMVNYARVLQREPFRFAGYLSGLCEHTQEVSEELFLEAIEILEDEAAAPMDRAVAFHLYRWTAWPHAQFSLRSTAYSDSRAKRALADSKIRQLPLFGELLSRMEIHEESYEKTIERAADAGRRAFLPIDPPYYGKDQELYNCDFDLEQFGRSIAELDCNVLVTMDTTDAAVEAYRGYKRAFYSMSYGGNARRPGVPQPRAIEQVACNYDPPFFPLTVSELGWMTEDDFLAQRADMAANDNPPPADEVQGAPAR